MLIDDHGLEAQCKYKGSDASTEHHSEQRIKLLPNNVLVEFQKEIFLR